MVQNARERPTRDMISVPECFEMFPDEQAADDWFVQTR